jgi:hypothetical protein
MAHDAFISDVAAPPGAVFWAGATCAKGDRQDLAVIAKRLKVRQGAVTTIESSGDMYVSTLRGFVEARGGQPQRVATFPDRPPVHREELGAPRRKREKRTAASAAEKLSV